MPVVGHENVPGQEECPARAYPPDRLSQTLKVRVNKGQSGSQRLQVTKKIFPEMSNRRKRDMERIVAQGALASRPILMASGVSKGNVAQGSLSSLAALPPRRGLGGAVCGNSDDPV
jgi:hypothetical protein